MNTSKRLELANLIALRLRGINIEDSIAQAACGDDDSDSADATPNSPGVHRNVGGRSARQSDSDSDRENDNGADGSAAAVDPHLPIQALSFQSEKVHGRDSQESTDDSSSGAQSPSLQHCDGDVVEMRTGVNNVVPNGHDCSSYSDGDSEDGEADGDSEDGEANDAAQLGAAGGGHAEDIHLPSLRTGKSQNTSPEKLLQSAVAEAGSPSTEDSSEHLTSPDVTPSSPTNPSNLSLAVSVEGEVTDSAATSPQPCTPVPSGIDAASESARLALEREKEHEAKLIMQLSEDVTSKLVLNRGATFLKHGRSGDPHYRFVWVSSDFKRIHWGDADTRNSKFMRFDDVSDVQAGKNTLVFQRSYGSKFSSIPESMCFSVVSGARTLDLQADSVERRNFWVQNLFVLFDIERRKADELKRQRTDLARDMQVSAHTSRWRAAYKQWETTKSKPADIGEITLGGVPSSLRSKVWPRAIGNQLQITRQLYDIFKTHAKNARNAHAKGDANAYVAHEASISVLYKDLPRTFAELGFFHNGGPLEQPLREVLESYIFFRPDVGYVQGMSFIAAMLLLYVEPFEAFVCFSNMMNGAHFLPFYSMDLQHIHSYASFCFATINPFCFATINPFCFVTINSFHRFSDAVFVSEAFVYPLTSCSSATSARSSTSSNCIFQRCISTSSTWIFRSAVLS
jgi:hypothetical protein